MVSRPDQANWSPLYFHKIFIPEFNSHTNIHKIFTTRNNFNRSVVQGFDPGCGASQPPTSLLVLTKKLKSRFLETPDTMAVHKEWDLATERKRYNTNEHSDLQMLEESFLNFRQASLAV